MHASPKISTGEGNFLLTRGSSLVSLISLAPAWQRDKNIRGLAGWSLPNRRHEAGASRQQGGASRQQGYAESCHLELGAMVTIRSSSRL